MSISSDYFKNVHQKLIDIYNSDCKVVIESRQALRKDNQLYHMIWEAKNQKTLEMTQQNIKSQGRKSWLKNLSNDD